MDYSEIYFVTFSGAVQYSREDAETRGYTVNEDDWFNQITVGVGAPKVGTTTKGTVLLHTSGKASRYDKGLHISVYGMDSGLFELTHYIS